MIKTEKFYKLAPKFFPTHNFRRGNTEQPQVKVHGDGYL